MKMIIRRQLYPHNTVPIKNSDDSEIEMRPIYRKAQPGPISKLLNTASSGTSIVRDVETLLTPVHELHYRDEQNFTREQREQASKERTERNLWRNDEVMEMLYTMQQVKALDKLNDKTVKSENVFKDVEAIMHKNGFMKKSHVQIWTKWKFLKSTYMTSRRNGVMPRIIPPQIYEVIHQMIKNQNLGYGEGGNSTNGSIDGDASSMNGGGLADAENGEAEDSFGMAHPIFGFRLGIVKAEPDDAGYERAENNASNNDPLEEQVKEEANKIADKANTTKTPPQIPPRGRGRPPKNPPAATSTPNTTTSPAASARNTQMPPLRVAPFAKALHSANALDVNRPPPPLTMPPTPRIQVASLASLKNLEQLKGVRKILPKPAAPQASEPQKIPVGQPIGPPLRIVKEITLHSRSSASPSPSYPKMKQIPMRKTPYSLRPDRAIPDLEGSPSPPPSPAVEKQSAKKFEEVSSTRHLIMQSNTNNSQNTINLKRNLEWQQEPRMPPSKQAKYLHDVEEHEEHHDASKSQNEDDSKHYGKMLQNVIIDLSSSLRKMQTQMMRDFFNKQNELLQKEHEFQLQQDRMIMRAFQEQTQEIMSSVKQLVGTISNKNTTTRQANKINQKYRIATKQNQSRDLEEEHEEMEAELMQENGDEDQDVEEEQQMEQDEEIYTDGEEEQQEQEIENQEENEQEDNYQEENYHEDPQDDEQEDYEAHQTVNNDQDDEDSEEDNQQDPIQMVSSELVEN